MARSCFDFNSTRASFVAKSLIKAAGSSTRSASGELQEVSGRGLFVVEALSNRWGVHEGTTHVWFELAAQTGASGPLGPRLGQGERPEALD